MRSWELSHTAHPASERQNDRDPNKSAREDCRHGLFRGQVVSPDTPPIPPPDEALCRPPATPTAIRLQWRMGGRHPLQTCSGPLDAAASDSRRAPPSLRQRRLPPLRRRASHLHSHPGCRWLPKPTPDPNGNDSQSCAPLHRDRGWGIFMTLPLGNVGNEVTLDTPSSVPPARRPETAPAHGPPHSVHATTSPGPRRAASAALLPPCAALRTVAVSSAPGQGPRQHHRPHEPGPSSLSSHSPRSSQGAITVRSPYRLTRCPLHP